MINLKIDLIRYGKRSDHNILFDIDIINTQKLAVVSKNKHIYLVEAFCKDEDELYTFSVEHYRKDGMLTLINLVINQLKILTEL